jgi:hypothetical protein
VAAVAVLAVCVWLAPRGGSSANEMPPPGSRALATVDPLPGDDAACRAADIWMVSTRGLPGICRLPESADLDVQRHCDDGRGSRWERSDVATLLGEPERPLVIFLHGNRYEPAAARRQGVLLARHLAARCPCTGPVRTVIFSWPSAQDGLLLRDGRAKYQRAHADGHYLGWLLGQVDPARPVAIVAYSFGALITLEALEHLVEAERAGRSDLAPWTVRQGRTHLVFIAPAVRCDALAPRGPYRDAFACIDRLTLIINSRDDALRFFPWLDPRVRADALGFVAMPRAWVPPGVEFSATDGAGLIGRQHGLALYLASPPLARRISTGALERLTDPADRP